MKTITLPGNETRPALGLGTWKLGESRARRTAEIEAVRLALTIGYRVLDTAEMYGDGGAEEVVGEAVASGLKDGIGRDELFIVSKVYPHNASRAGVITACERSLRRLKLDQIDLYLLHWRGNEPLAETLAGFDQLMRRGLIRRWGVSNFDADDMQELFGLEGGAACSANQVYYSLGSRGIEFDLMPWQQAHGVPLMAYSPIDQGALVGRGSNPALQAIAERHGATPAQVALVALLARPNVMVIPKAAREAHLRENWQAAMLTLGEDDLAALDRAFPPPRRKSRLAMI